MKRSGSNGQMELASSGTNSHNATDVLLDGSLAANAKFHGSSVSNALEIELDPLVTNNDDNDEALIMDHRKKEVTLKTEQVVVIVLLGGRLALTRRQLGVLGAVINGAWGGLSLVPMHYARKYDGIYGSAYLISFASGALIVNVAIWIIYLAYELHQQKGAWFEAMEALPKFHVRELWAPGLLAGLLYSLGNFTAILTVASLGQSIGYPFCQMQLFVSGCWGIFYFKEVKGADTISKWFLSAALALLGIVWLAYEREGDSGGH